MWYPHSVLVPYYLEPFPTTVIPQWPVIPTDQQKYLNVNGAVGFRDGPLSVQDGKEFLLHKSVFELIKIHNFLELTDPKLLGWYLSLSAEDRKIIQEEGGFLCFLINHPALEVTGKIVHLKQQVLESNLCLPSTDMSSKLNKSRHPTFYGASRCLNCGTSFSSRTTKCRCCSKAILNPEEILHITGEDEEFLGLLPNSVKEELNLIKARSQELSARQFDQLSCNKNTLNITSVFPAASSNSSQQAFDGPHPIQTSPDQQEMHHTEAQHLSHLWGKEVWKKGSVVFKDPSAQASFRLDMELDLQCHNPKTAKDQVHVLTYTSADFPYLNREIPPEYYSLNSTELEHTSGQWSDASEPACSDSVMSTKGSSEASTLDDPVQNSYAENSPFPDSLSCNSSEWTDLTDYQDLDDDTDLGCELKTHTHHGPLDGISISHGGVNSDASWSGLSSDSKQCTPGSVSASDESFLSVDQSELNVMSTRPCEKGEATPVPPAVTKPVDSTSDVRACFMFNKATETCQDVFVKPCQDIGVGTVSFTICDREVQTPQMSTSEKCIVTELCMSDLDVLSEEFEYLKMMEEEFKCLMDKVARSTQYSVGGPGSKGQKSDCGCDAFHRARRAELQLLALQFAMCQQHCWRRFYTSPLGESSLLGADALPDVILQTLKTLKEDYLEMKQKILAGVHLDSLDPLSVDTVRIASGTCYSPAQVFSDYLEDVLLEQLSRNLVDKGQLDQINKVETTAEEFISRTPTPLQWQDSANTSSDSKGVTRRCRAVHVLEQQSGISFDTKPDLNSNEAWFDAEEELATVSQDCKKEKQMGQCEEEMQMNQEGDKGNTDQTSLLRVTDLPSNITKCDLLLWFEPYHVSQVNLNTFNKNDRAALVILKSPSDAEAAVREVNGRFIQGHTLHVEHIHRFPAGGQDPIKASCADYFPAACKSGPAGEELNISKNNFHSSRPLRCSLDRLINIQDKPSASGTCVPQHYATMGSFDTLMARLSECHPNMSRQRIVGALLELQAKHQGFLSGLPLRVIADMASDLLIQQSPTE